MTTHSPAGPLSALGRAIAQPPTVAGVAPSNAMSGLERRTVGFVDVLAQSIGAVAPAAGTATMPALIFAQTGSSMLVAILAAWLLTLCVGATLNQFALRIAAPGSLYTFATQGLGAGAGFATAAALLVGYGFISMFGLVGAAYFLQHFAAVFAGPWAMAPGVTAGALVAIGAVCLVVLRRGIRISARVTLVIELLAIVVMLALLGIVLAHLSPAQLAAPLVAGLPTAGGFIAGTAVAITAFVGFESAAALGREAARPFLTIPRTIRWTVLGVGAVYLLSSYTQLAGAGAYGPVFEGGSTVSTLANDSHVAAVGTLLDLGLAASFTACAIASLTALARVVFTLGREGVLPVRMGRVDPQRKTPFTALGIAVLLTVAVPLGLVLGGFTPWQALQCLIVVAAAGYIVAYVMASASLPVFLRRIGEATWRADALAAIAAIGLAVLLVSYLVVTAPSQPLAVMLVGALALAAGLAYLLLRMTRARVLERAGLHDHATTSDLLGAP